MTGEYPPRNRLCTVAARVCDPDLPKWQHRPAENSKRVDKTSRSKDVRASLSRCTNAPDEPPRPHACGSVTIIRALAVVLLHLKSARSRRARMEPRHPSAPSASRWMMPALAAAVRSALLADPDLGLRDIAVDVDRGVVSLSGVVRTADEVQRAATVAQRAAGVREVKSALKVGS